MKNLLLVILCTCILLLPFSKGQTINSVLDLGHGHTNCILELSEKGRPLSIPYEFKNKHSRLLDFTFTYQADGESLEGFECAEFPAEAQTALEFAASIWSDALNNSQNIKIRACWSDDANLANGTLELAGAANNVTLMGETVIENVFYPIALAEQLIDGQFPDMDADDINIILNGKRTDWHFGTDAMPGTNVDLVSVILHELGHGLGFSGSGVVDDGDNTNGTECNDIPDNGCFRFTTPFVYDVFIDIDNEDPLTNLSANPVDMGNVLQGGSTTGGAGGLEFDETNSNVHRNLRHGIDIHTPDPFVSGSSYSHFSESTLPDELMSPSIAAGQAIHDPGMSILVMEEIGWTATTVPVDFISFTAKLKDEMAYLDWNTALEIDNDHFEIQRSINGKDFQQIGLINGKGNFSGVSNYNFIDRNPLNGVNYYRLKQVDFNGDFAFSPLAQINYDRIATDAVALSPNPVKEELRLSIGKGFGAVQKICVLNSSGQIIRLIETMEQSPSELALNLSDLSPGIYLIQIQGIKHNFTSKFSKI